MRDYHWSVWFERDPDDVCMPPVLVGMSYEDFEFKTKLGVSPGHTCKLNWDAIGESYRITHYRYKIYDEEDPTKFFAGYSEGSTPEKPVKDLLPGTEEAAKAYKKVAEAIIDSWSNEHYDFEYKLKGKELVNYVVKVDPYFVAKQWQLGKKDSTGVLFHCLKTIARFGEKNSVEREIKALYNQVKRLAELEGVELDA